MQTKHVVVAGIGTLIAGGLGVCPSTAVTPAAMLGTGSAKQYVTVESAEVAKDRRSVSGQIRWHAKTLHQKGTNRFTVWAGIDNGGTDVVSLGTIRRNEAEVTSVGTMPFTVPWSKAKAAKVAKATTIRVSVTQLFNKAGSDKAHEKALFDSIFVTTSGKVPGVVPADGSCSRNILKPHTELRRCRFVGMDLYRMDANTSHLDYVEFIDCNMAGMDLSYIFGYEAKFSGDDLGATNFRHALLTSATFGERNRFVKTDLGWADISKATFEPMEQGSTPLTNSLTKCPPKGMSGPCTFEFQGEKA